MKKILTLLFGLLLPLLSIADSIEITGAEMTYTYIGGRDYEVKLNIYTRCNQSKMDSVYIKVSSPNSNFKSYSQLADLKDMGEVIFQCGPTPFISKCESSTSGLDGIRKWTATAKFTLYTGISCEYVFSWKGCCRSNMFTTGSAGEPFYIEAYANLCDNYKLSSPQFDDSYSPWLANNQCATKTNYATGTLGSKSSYTYHIISAKSDVNKSVTYISPYTYRKPATNSGGFSDQDNFDTTKKCWGLHLDNITGDLNIYPINKNEIFPLAIEMIGLSNGQVVSRVTRDLMYWVVPFINENRHPVVTGIDCQQLSELTLEPFQSKCFTICSFDPDLEDTVRMSAGMEMPDGKFAVEQGKKWPKAQFCWYPKLTDMREEPYKLIVRADDNFCSDVIGVNDSSFFEKTILIYVKDVDGHFGFGESSSHFNLKIYPQPASSKVYAEIPEHSVRKVALIDMTGRSVNTPYTFANGKLEMDINSLPAGSYILQVLTDKNLYSGKVIVGR